MKDESTTATTTSTKFQRNLNHEQHNKHNTSTIVSHTQEERKRKQRKKEKANSVSKLRRNVSVKNEFNIFFIAENLNPNVQNFLTFTCYILGFSELKTKHCKPLSLERVDVKA